MHKLCKFNRFLSSRDRVFRIKPASTYSKAYVRDIGSSGGWSVQETDEILQYAYCYGIGNILFNSIKSVSFQAWPEIRLMSEVLFQASM